MAAVDYIKPENTAGVGSPCAAFISAEKCAVHWKTAQGYCEGSVPRTQQMLCIMIH